MNNLFWGIGQWPKYKNQIVISVKHHHLNPTELTMYKVQEFYFFFLLFPCTITVYSLYNKKIYKLKMTNKYDLYQSKITK